MNNKIIIRNNEKLYNLYNAGTLFLVSGPCVVESAKITQETAKKLKDICEDLSIPFIFKASYKKANRTSGKSFRGIGSLKALEILGNINSNLNIPVLTDVHSVMEAIVSAEYVQVLQIPAFLCRQTEILEAAGETKKIVNIKKGQFMSPEDMKFQADKIKATGNKQIMITERGTTFGYSNLVVDMKSFVILRKFGYPVIYDASHSVQLPSSNNGVSGGRPEFIIPLSRAAVAAGINGIFLETHPNPSRALSDASSMFSLSKVKPYLKQLQKLHKDVLSFQSA